VVRRDPEKARDPAADRTPSATTTNEAATRIAQDADSVDGLARLTSYRSAAQAIRRQDTPLEERGTRMIALMQEARAEPDRWIREIAAQIVHSQAMLMVEGDEALQQDRVRGRLEAAAHRLRAQGYMCCPTCEQRLSDPTEWSFWAALRKAEVDRLTALDREAGEAA
jgi:hypothetical protein